MEAMLSTSDNLGSYGQIRHGSRKSQLKVKPSPRRLESIDSGVWSEDLRVSEDDSSNPASPETKRKSVIFDVEYEDSEETSSPSPTRGASAMLSFDDIRRDRGRDGLIPQRTYTTERKIKTNNKCREVFITTQRQDCGSEKMSSAVGGAHCLSESSEYSIYAELSNSTNKECETTAISKYRFRLARTKAYMTAKLMKLKKKRSLKASESRVQLVTSHTSSPDVSSNAVEATVTSCDTTSGSDWTVYSEQFRSLCKNFAGETTAHGYKRTLTETRSSTSKLLWFLAILSVTCMVFTTLHNLTKEQEMYAFTSRIHSQPHSSLTFPSVTICNFVPHDKAKKAGLLDSWGNTSSLLKEFSRILQENVGLFNTNSGLINTFNEAEFENLTTLELDQMFGLHLDDFIQHCVWNGRNVSSADQFVRTKSTMGSCFTFNTNMEHLLSVDKSGSLSGLSLTINLGSATQTQGLFTGVKVLVHGANDFPNIRESGLLVPPSTVAYISVKKKKYKFLPAPYKAYGSDYCSDDYSNKGSNYYNLTSYSGCLAECRFRTLIEKCGCNVFGGDPEVPGVPPCPIDQLACYFKTMREFRIKSPSNSTACYCPLPCTKVEYMTQISTASYTKGTQSSSQEQFVKLKIFMEDLFTYVEEHVPKNSWADTFGNFGGQMGLFTGASVLTVVEFLELGVLFLWAAGQIGYSAARHKWRTARRGCDSLPNHPV